MGLKIPSLTVPGTFWARKRRLAVFHKILATATFDRTAYTGMHCVTTFWATMGRMYDGGPIIL